MQQVYILQIPQRSDKLYKERHFGQRQSAAASTMCESVTTSAKMASGFHFVLLLCVTSGLLAAASCCEEDTKKVHPSCPAPCPPGWTQFNSRCFMFHITAKTWMEAERTCLSVDGNLASIRSVEEREFLQSYISRVAGQNRRTWIGGSDAVQEGVWMWSDGAPFEYTRWHSGQPDNHRNLEDCVEINWSGTFWNDLPCTTRLPFLCSKRL